MDIPTESYHQTGVPCDRYVEMYGYDDDGKEEFIGRIVRRESDGQWEVGSEIMLERGVPCYGGPCVEVKYRFGET